MQRQNTLWSKFAIFACAYSYENSNNLYGSFSSVIFSYIFFLIIVRQPVSVSVNWSVTMIDFQSNCDKEKWNSIRHCSIVDRAALLHWFDVAVFPVHDLMTLAKCEDPQGIKWLWVNVKVFRFSWAWMSFWPFIMWAIISQKWEVMHYDYLDEKYMK